jgi:glycosyltransferase involved in cell wall biosynthesis
MTACLVFWNGIRSVSGHRMKSDHHLVVSVIVPARNEEACLALCLESLVAQTGIDFEIIVVDDASTDRTAEIARSFSSLNHSPDEGVRGFTSHVGAGALTRPRPTDSPDEALPPVHVISAPPLPDNWTGKNNAMSAGAKVAHGNAKWLLFTDADTVHKPGSLAGAIAEAEQHGAALLSYSPEQEVRTFWEKAVMPVIFAELAATYPPKKVNDPTSPIAAANGQYLLISRQAYDAVGGHTKIAGDLLEDVAMARLVKSSGRKIFFRYGGDAVRTRMYRSWAQMKEGWTKSLALLFTSPRALGFVRGIEFDLIWVNVIAVIVLLYGHHKLAIMTGSLAAILLTIFWVRIRRAHFSLASNLLALGGLAVFSRLLFRSAKLHRKHRVTWKGRSYKHIREKPIPHRPARTNTL